MVRITSNTTVEAIGSFQQSSVIEKAISRMSRDISMTVETSSLPGVGIVIGKDDSLDSEQWTIDAVDVVSVKAGDELGAVYALLYISRETLGIKPLWFWNDQKFVKDKEKTVHFSHAESICCAYRFRGWFINDEVLFLGWRPYGSDTLSWEMAMEALLRLGGNIVIPGTDRDARRFAPLASSMGLWITHHHAEPLGAEMFSRAFPGKTPSFITHPELYRKLWREAVAKQKGMKIVWTLGFRGQGDKPFWDDDEAYDTDEKRAGLINRIIAEQAELVREYDPDAVFAYNIYSESVNFYRKGLLELPSGTIKLFADNGYGAMVTRRNGNDDPREISLPIPSDASSENGMYYHVSFYDLQAANHLTPTPVSYSFISSSLNSAYESGIRSMIMVNVSNVKPHLSAISLLADFWRNGRADYLKSLSAYASLYFTDTPDDFISYTERYADASHAFGTHEDNKGGDQAFAYPVRMLATAWVKGEERSPDFSFILDAPLPEQMDYLQGMMERSHRLYSSLHEDMKNTSSLMISDLGAAVAWYVHASSAVLSFVDSYKLFSKGKLLECFIALGDAASEYEKAIGSLRASASGKWEGFYSNDALTDTDSMAELMKSLMEWVRIIGDGPGFWKWHRYLTYSDEDKGVALITNYEKRMNAYDMYLKYIRMMKDRR